MFPMCARVLNEKVVGEWLEVSQTQHPCFDYMLIMDDSPKQLIYFWSTLNLLHVWYVVFLICSALHLKSDKPDISTLLFLFTSL